MTVTFWVVLISNLLLRLAGISRPILGNSAAYGTGQAMMTRFFVESNFTNLLYPQINVLAGGKPGFVLLYYPVSSLLVAILSKFLGGNIIFLGRLQAVVFFGLSAVYLFYLVRRLTTSEKLALASTTVFSLSPLSIIYGQSFQNEMATVFFSLVFLFHFSKFYPAFSLPHFFISSLGLSGVLLTRPNCIYLLLPAFYAVYFHSREMKNRFQKCFLALAAVALAGLMLPGYWFLHAWRLTRTSPYVYSSVFAQIQVKSSFLSLEIFNPEYFRRFLDLLMGIGLTPTGFTLLITGLLLPLTGRWRETGVFIVWFAACLGGSFLMIPEKIIHHDFYMLHLVLPSSPLIGIAYCNLLDRLKGVGPSKKFFTASFLLISFLVTMRYAAHPAFKTPENEKHFSETAQLIQKVTDKNQDKLIVQGTHTLLYYADRYGWGLELKKREAIEEYNKYLLRPNENWSERSEAFKDPQTALEYFHFKEGATHFVVSNPKEFLEAGDLSQYVYDHYKVLDEKKGVFIIFDLKSKP